MEKDKDNCFVNELSSFGINGKFWTVLDLVRRGRSGDIINMSNIPPYMKTIQCNWMDIEMVMRAFKEFIIDEESK